MNNKTNLKKVLLIIFIFSLTIRLLYGIFYFKAQGTSNFIDDWEYINYAKNIISQGIFAPIESTKVGPGFPLIVAFSFMTFGETFLPVIVLNALISALLCVLIFYIGRELFNEKVAILASLWSIFYVLFIKYTPHVLKENWLAFLFPLIIFLFIKATKGNKVSLFLVPLSILYAYFIHMDERFFTYFPVLLMGFIFLDRDSWKKGLKKALVFFSLVLILMLPWLIRNLNVYNRVVILTVRTTIFTDKIFGYTVEVEKLKNQRERELEFWEKASKLILERKEAPIETGVPIKAAHLELLKKAINLGYIPHKFTWFERYVANFKEFWRPIRFRGGFVEDGYRFEGPSWSLKHNLSVGLTYGLLLPFFIVGILFTLKNKYGIFIVLIIVIHTFIHVILFHARDRYRMPIDAFIIIIAFYGLQQLFLELQNRKNQKCRKN